jgi:hypothetical protein
VRLEEIAKHLGLERLTPELAEEHVVDVEHAHASDLLSDILAFAPPRGVALTIQAHLNAVAVAVHARQAAVIFTSDRRPADDVVARAIEERLPLFLARQGTFDVAGRLYELGVRGRIE